MEIRRRTRSWKGLFFYLFFISKITGHKQRRLTHAALQTLLKNGTTLCGWCAVNMVQLQEPSSGRRAAWGLGVVMVWRGCFFIVLFFNKRGNVWRDCAGLGSLFAGSRRVLTVECPCCAFGTRVIPASAVWCEIF